MWASGVAPPCCGSQPARQRTASRLLGVSVWACHLADGLAREVVVVVVVDSCSLCKNKQETG